MDAVQKMTELEQDARLAARKANEVFEQHRA